MHLKPHLPDLKAVPRPRPLRTCVRWASLCNSAVCKGYPAWFLCASSPKAPPPLPVQPDGGLSGAGDLIVFNPTPPAFVAHYGSTYLEQCRAGRWRFTNIWLNEGMSSQASPRAASDGGHSQGAVQRDRALAFPLPRPPPSEGVLLSAPRGRCPGPGARVVRQVGLDWSQG